MRQREREADDSLVPVTVRGMNRAMAWEIANLGPRARHVAEEAAQRAGMTAEEWLNEAIVEHAVSARSEQVDQEAFHERRQESLARQDAAAEGARPIRPGEDRRNREVENTLESSVRRIEQQITRNGWRLARAFEAVALASRRALKTRLTSHRQDSPTQESLNSRPSWLRRSRHST